MNILGEFLIRLVNTNSKRHCLNLALMQRAWMLPINRDLAFRMDKLDMVPKPMPKAVHGSIGQYMTMSSLPILAVENETSMAQSLLF